ncbi:LysR substrate-binding domain-containing protein [Vibrio alfacsensis]|uniref:LysR substrate-binding domain-containing protein n=1 Tax=Vibrio alfacsensis TaxID=1074311 RepID=UPI004068D23D
MKFQQLHAFKAVYELGTVTAASNSLHLTQPAVSKLIAALEHRIGFKLFERIKGRLIPTAQGSAFYFEVSKAFNALDTLEDSARDIRTRHWGSLHIAAFPLLANSYLPKLLGQYIKNVPELKGSLKAYRSEDVLRRTEIQSCDVGFAAVDEISSGVSHIQVKCACQCILPPESPLCSKSHLEPKDLTSVPFIRSETDSTQQLVNAAFFNAKVKRNDLLEVSFASSTATLVSEGVGAAIVDPFTANQARKMNHDVCIKPFKPTIPFQFSILFPALRPIPHSVTLFVDSFFAMASEEGIVLERSDISSVESD